MGVVRSVWFNINICVFRWSGWVGWSVLKGYDWIGARGRRESTSLYDIRYIKFSHEQIISHQPDKHD